MADKNKEDLENQKKNAIPSEKELKKEAVTGKEYKEKEGHVQPKRRHAENEGSEYIDQRPNREGKNIEQNTEEEADYDKMRGK